MTLEEKLAKVKAEYEAELRGRQIEREIWETRLKAEREKSKELSEWVEFKEALRIVHRKSYNCLSQWAEKGLINPPRKIGGRNYWERKNLLKMSPDGK